MSVCGGTLLTGALFAGDRGIERGATSTPAGSTCSSGTNGSAQPDSERAGTHAPERTRSRATPSPRQRATRYPLSLAFVGRERRPGPSTIDAPPHAVDVSESGPVSRGASNDNTTPTSGTRGLVASPSK